MKREKRYQEMKLERCQEKFQVVSCILLQNLLILEPCPALWTPGNSKWQKGSRRRERRQRIKKTWAAIFSTRVARPTIRCLRSSSWSDDWGSGCNGTIPDMSSSWNVYLPFRKIRNMMTIPASWTMAHLRSVPTRLAHWVTLRWETLSVLSKYHHPS